MTACEQEPTLATLQALYNQCLAVDLPSLHCAIVTVSHP